MPIGHTPRGVVSSVTITTSPTPKLRDGMIMGDQYRVVTHCTRAS
jgi:hypothetical protein